MITDPAKNRPSTRSRPKRRGGWRRAFSTFFGVLTTIILLVLLGGVGFAVYLVRSTTAALPSTDAMSDYMPGGVTEILATDKDPATGQNVVLGRVFSQYKIFAPITEIPATLQDATISIEDERFYSHAGIDFRGVARAIFRDVAGHHLSEGASTLTQQLARNIFLNQKKTFNRKLKEAVLAIELEKNYSKEQILERYLNEVCYGNNTYGVRAAAKLYFGKPLDKLTIGEAALIAGLPQSPTGYDPFKHLDSAVGRRNDVLEHLAAQHYITTEQYGTAYAEKPKLVAAKLRHQTEFKAPYFTTYVLRQLIRKYGVDGVYKGGLKVYTTLNYKMQQEGERALINGVLNGAEDHVSDGALVSLEPRTGYIRAMVGGLDFKKNQYNNVTQGTRQPGSSFKAFVYTTAFMRNPKRFDPDTDILDAPVSFPGHPPYRPKNSEGRFEGDVSIERAFAKSINVVAVKVANEIGVQHVIETARAMGITTPLRPDLSLALGSYPVHPLEIASAYSIFPNNGNHALPMAIIRVVDGEGKQLENDDPQVEMNVVPPYVVAEMSRLTRAVVEHGTAANAKGIHEVEEAHGKTGTTSENKDAWFIGYTPELTTAVWVGGAKQVIKNGKVVRTRYVPMAGVTGGVVCAPIWARFMLAAIPIQRKAGQQNPVTPEKIFAQHRSEGSAARAVAAIAPDDDTPLPNDTSDVPSGSPATVDSSSGKNTSADSTGASSDNNTPDEIAPTQAAPVAVTPTLNAAARRPPLPLVPTPDPATTLANGESALPHPLHSVAAAPRLVTVTLCEDTGLLATRWCPSTVTRTVPASSAPHRHCTQHRAQPGDH